MKKPSLLPAALLFLSAMAVSAQQRREMRDVATHEQLSNTLRQEQTNDPMSRMAKSEGKDPSKENQPQDLLKRSDILCFNGMATLVPKQSILAMPAQFSNRLGIQPGVKLVPWGEFFAVNQGWITAQEVTLNQARGQEPLSDVLKERLAKSTNVIIATLQGGPISKLQYTAPPTPPQTK